MDDHPQTPPRPDFLTKPTLDGEQVTLVPLTELHLPALRPMLADPEVARLSGSHGEPPDDAKLYAWYRTRIGQDDRLDLAVLDRATGACVGEAVLNGWDPANESCSFRISLVPGSYGRGLGTEATRLICGYGFEKLGLHRISLEVHAFNPRGRRAYEKAGFVAEGVLRDALRWDGEWVDTAVMSILAGDWERSGGAARSDRPGVSG